MECELKIHCSEVCLTNITDQKLPEPFEVTMANHSPYGDDKDLHKVGLK